MASPEILPTNTPALFAEAVRRAAGELARGGVVALPTETVYGLAANALSTEAVGKIYTLKGRPAHNPVIVHVASRSMAMAMSSDWTALADRMADAFWPGPLTLVVRRSAPIPDIVTAGGPTVGLRWPSHPLMPAVIQACGFPLAAPSANLANQLSPTCAAHVASQLGDRLSLIIDGGDCNVGIESTVVDVTGSTPVVLRPGIISAEAILVAARGWTGSTARAIPDRQSVPDVPDTLTSSEALRSPGQLTRHYAPRQRMVIWNWKDEADLHQQVAGEGLAPDDIGVIAYRHIPLSGRFSHTHIIPDDAEAYARALYGQLHQCDAHGYRLIIVEEPPDRPEWEGVRDRLRRGSSGSGI